MFPFIKHILCVYNVFPVSTVRICFVLQLLYMDSQIFLKSVLQDMKIHILQEKNILLTNNFTYYQKGYSIVLCKKGITQF